MSTAAVTPDQKPIELTLGDGSVVKGANLEEAFENLKKAKENASAEIRRQKEQAEALQNQYQNLQQEVERLKKPVQTDGSKFDKETYYKMLNDDPIQAQDYLDRYRWDRDPKDVIQSFQNVENQVSVLTQQSVAAAFLQQHADDFPPDPEAAKALTNKMREYTSNGIPFNVMTLNAAYNELVQNQVIKPVQATQTQESGPNPSLSGAGRQSTEDADIQKAEKMTDADLEKFLRTKGVLR